MQYVKGIVAGGCMLGCGYVCGVASILGDRQVYELCVDNDAFGFSPEVSEDRFAVVESPASHRSEDEIVEELRRRAVGDFGEYWNNSRYRAYVNHYPNGFVWWFQCLSGSILAHPNCIPLSLKAKKDE